MNTGTRAQTTDESDRDRPMGVIKLRCTMRPSHRLAHLPGQLTDDHLTALGYRQRVALGEPDEPDKEAGAAAFTSLASNFHSL